MVEEIIGRLPGLTEAKIRRLEDEIRRERQRRASSAGGGGEGALLVQEGATVPVSEVLEYRPDEDGYLQLELRRYIRRNGSARERGSFWYWKYHEGGSVRSSTWARLATRRALWPPSSHNLQGSRLLPWPDSAQDTKRQRGAVRAWKKVRTMVAFTRHGGQPRARRKFGGVPFSGGNKPDNPHRFSQKYISSTKSNFAFCATSSCRKPDYEKHDCPDLPTFMTPSCSGERAR
jgi:hypothetical protein